MAQGAPIGNQFWKLRGDLSETGKKLTPEEVVTKAQEYIDRCINEPLKEQDFRGKDANEIRVDRMRAMTLEGLYFHLDISKETWRRWRSEEKYSGIITRIENLMFTYDFEGAAANMLNPNTIARKLGIQDNSEVTLIKPTPIFGDKGLI